MKVIHVAGTKGKVKSLAKYSISNLEYSMLFDSFLLRYRNFISNDAGLLLKYNECATLRFTKAIVQ